jgi:4-hydroxybenzoate polyprenyltransferase
LIPLTIVGGFIGLQYSIKPFKFKSQGYLQLFCLWGIIFFGPMLYTAIITKGFPSLIQLAIFVAYGFLQMGIILLNTAEDYTEDKAAGLKTIIVAMGLHRAMKFAWWLTCIAGIALQVAFVILFYLNHAPLFLFSAILILTIGWVKIVFDYKNVIDKMIGKNEEEANKELKKKGMKVPEWLKIGAYCTLSVVVIFFLWKAYFSN